MIVRHDGPIRKFRWRFFLLVEAEPRVWWSALVIAALTGTLTWRATSPLWTELLAGFDAGPVVAAPLAAAASALTAAAAAGWWSLTTVSRLDSPDTPFPAYHVRVLLDEARAPRPRTVTRQAVTIRYPTPITRPVVAVRLSSDPTATRSPHVCCPHPDPPQDPIAAGLEALTRRTRGVRGLRRRRLLSPELAGQP